MLNRERVCVSGRVFSLIVLIASGTHAQDLFVPAVGPDAFPPVVAPQRLGQALWAPQPLPIGNAAAQAWNAFNGLSLDLQRAGILSLAESEDQLIYAAPSMVPEEKVQKITVTELRREKRTRLVPKGTPPPLPVAAMPPRVGVRGAPIVAPIVEPIAAPNLGVPGTAPQAIGNRRVQMVKEERVRKRVVNGKVVEQTYTVMVPVVKTVNDNQNDGQVVDVGEDVNVPQDESSEPSGGSTTSSEATTPSKSSNSKSEDATGEDDQTENQKNEEPAMVEQTYEVMVPHQKEVEQRYTVMVPGPVKEHLVELAKVQVWTRDGLRLEGKNLKKLLTSSRPVLRIFQAPPEDFELTAAQKRVLSSETLFLWIDPRQRIPR